MAVTLRGCAHFVGDQVNADGSPSGFNPHRLYRISSRYFIYFYTAFALRMMLSNLIEKARMVDDKNDEMVYALQAELSRVITYAYFAIGSEREAIQKFYEHCIRAQRVDSLLQDAKRSIDELASICRERKQLQIAENFEGLQHIAHQLEAIILAVYAAEFGHMIYDLSENRAIYGVVGLTCLAIIVLWLVLTFTYQSKRKRGDRNGNHEFPFSWGFIVTAIILSITTSLWFLVGERHFELPGVHPLTSIPESLYKQTPNRKGLLRSDSFVPRPKNLTKPPRPQKP
jgi:hypothetical protein